MNKMSEVLELLKKDTKKAIDVRVGDTVKVHVKIREGEKERVQIFEGIVIKRRKSDNSTFTVRKISYNIGVERVFAFNSPMIEKIEIVQRGKARRARLFYLRTRKGKEALLEDSHEAFEGSDTKKTKGENIRPTVKAAATTAASVVS